ncbi:ArsJ-associated glyceraldehyde-3-phosphate dehydrogenase [Aliiroseovarius lamellibrachiae]|uniref:ArsJ-associated glyceraldehyde-3-phosphate dehydrogenase n=1 Tax=Aliiroseovarius lamellibrachiae TaxID=1924933 RepID=UPI001BE0703E|nr:ArsJ-associated glyceraldehyde-3-phosphate dehydrogenase [Aliiroseovarius lamellibrachiae]MBT2132474.1 ArsJ-associated glyceraldehyde-3-phosphate dehydrogenase [Aliiroseovarius lamellibrachiae]
MTTYAINGLGRMGKLALRPLLERGAKIAFMNDALGGPEMHAHLLEFDTVHGRWRADFSYDEESITIDGVRIPVTATRNLTDLPLDGVDVVIDCTGAFKTAEKLAPYFEAGVKKVVVSAPVKEDEAANIVFGVNDDIYDPRAHRIVTAASCTTNCLAPVIKVVLEEFGIKHGSMTTIHDVTNTQTIVDRPAKDLRRARSALNSLIPTTTGSAKAITQIFPELTGKLNGHAVRVPLLNASLTDMVFELKRETTAEEVNAAFEKAANGPLLGILGYEEKPLVSTDYTNDDRSTIVDALSTMVVNGTQLKIYAWYDNEWGYAHRLVDVALMVGASV